MTVPEAGSVQRKLSPETADLAVVRQLGTVHAAWPIAIAPLLALKVTTLAIVVGTPFHSDLWGYAQPGLGKRVGSWMARAVLTHFCSRRDAFVMWTISLHRRGQ